ncbi:TPA: VPA1269 family protein [Pseudomonas aeruginosa]
MTDMYSIPQRSHDLSLAWLPETYGVEWREWQELAARWLASHHSAVSQKLTALTWFLENYLIALGLPADPAQLLARDFVAPSFFQQLTEPVQLRSRAKGYTRRDSARHVNNVTSEFLDWVLLERYAIDDDYGRPTVPYEYRNPVPRLAYGEGSAAPTESVRAPLPYRYISELRQIICPKPDGHFRDWSWAHGPREVERHTRGGDWIPVYYDQIDPDDPDCVWRSRLTPEYQQQLAEIGNRRKVVEIWSPVRAMVLYLKLELPLRTFQVRLLDSGEADTWRYSGGGWETNEGPLANGSRNRPWQRGVFRRLVYGGDVQIGIYVNTNKTADAGKDALDRGYVIPWRHERVLYWLEKLRNWQAKYNPITQPTPWADLKPKHLDDVKSPQVLERMGMSCFLFRHAAASDTEDRHKPVTSSHVLDLWVKLLRELERRCQDRGETSRSGEPLQFAKQGSRRACHYPLHALRVSLLTCFAIEGGVPIPILSKLVAGHSRILMTLYYTKVGQAHMNAIMGEAEQRLVENQQAQFEKFLLNAEYQQLKALCAFNDESGLAAIDQSRQPSGWEVLDKGICPVACAGCHNGGALLRESAGGYDRLYAPVPRDSQGNPRNCVRCRWFVTGPAFLAGLVAHFNNLSYEASETAARYGKYENAVRVLEDEQWDCSTDGRLFLQQAELTRLQQLLAQEAERADATMNGMHATMRLIKQCLELARGGPDTDDTSSLALIASEDMHAHIALQEAGSELHQLEVVCRNAVLFPGYDATRATLRRSQVIDAMLQLNQREPVFLRLAPDDQLHVGNAVMRLIEARTGSLDAAVQFVHAARALADVGILDDIEQIAGTAAADWSSEDRSPVLLNREVSA